MSRFYEYYLFEFIITIFVLVWFAVICACATAQFELAFDQEIRCRTTSNGSRSDQCVKCGGHAVSETGTDLCGATGLGGNICYHLASTMASACTLLWVFCIHNYHFSFDEVAPENSNPAKSCGYVIDPNYYNYCFLLHCVGEVVMHAMMMQTMKQTRKQSKL